jgi:hypothetical protein
MLSKPAMVRNKVDLPHPEGPKKQTNSRSCMSKEMPFKMALSPSCLCRFLILSLLKWVSSYWFFCAAGV